MALATLSPSAKQYFWNIITGAPLAGGFVYTVSAGGSYPGSAVATYQDSNALIVNSNPIALNAAGYATIYLQPGKTYKYIVTDANGVIQYTQDGIEAVPTTNLGLDIIGTAGDTFAAGQAAYLSDGSGGKTPGVFYLADSANAYSSSTAAQIAVAPSAIQSGSLGTFRQGGIVSGYSGLTAGTTYYIGTAGAITTTAPANARVIGVSDNTTTQLDVVSAPSITRLISPIISTSVITPASAGIGYGVCGGRLTLTAGSPVPSADVTGATSIFFTPYSANGGPIGNIGLYDGTTNWAILPFVETTLALGTLVNAQGYDIFAYNNAGVLALETAEWANAVITMTIAAPGVVTWTAHGLSTGNSVTFTTTGALPTGLTANTAYFITVVDANSFKLSTTLTTLSAGTFITTSGTQSGVHTGHQPQARQTALVLQNGVLSKTGTLTRRYVGSFFTDSTTTTSDAGAGSASSGRHLYNYYNRVARALSRIEATASWNYTTATVRQANGATANQIQLFQGVAETGIDLSLGGVSAVNTGGSPAISIGIGEDSLVTYTRGGTSGLLTNAQTIPLPTIRLSKVPSIGHHLYAWLEWSQAAGTTAWVSNTASGGSTITAGLEGTWFA